MRDKDLPFDRTKHVCYTKNAKKCVQKLLRRYYDEQMAAGLWEKIQLQYCEFLKEEPAMKDAKITTSIYDPILVFAWYQVIPNKPPLGDVQQEWSGCENLSEGKRHTRGGDQEVPGIVPHGIQQL